MTKLQDIAAETLQWFEVRRRDFEGGNGSKEFWATKQEGRPQWIQDMCFEAHMDMLPNDYSYEFIVEALEALINYEDPDDINLEPGIYNGELLSWISSNNCRADFADQAVEEWGPDGNTMERLAHGQAWEKSQVLGIVRRTLEARIEDSEDSEEASSHE